MGKGGKGEGGKRAAPAKRRAPSPEERAQWLMRFLQADVKTLRTGELIDTSSDAVHYLLDPSSILAPGQEADAVAGLRWQQADPGEDDETDAYIRSLGRGADDDDAIRRPTLAKVQGEVRAGLEELHAGRTWKVPTTPEWMLRPQPDGSLARIYKGSVLAMLVASAAELLTAIWPRVRRCEYGPCSLFFLQTDGRQRYHDAKCSGTARYERFKPKRIPKTHRVTTKRGRK